MHPSLKTVLFGGKIMKVGKSVVQFKRYNSMRNHKLNTNPQYYALYTRKGDFFTNDIGKKYSNNHYTKEEIINLLTQSDVHHVFDAYPRATRYSYNHKKYLYEYNSFTEWFCVLYCGLVIYTIDKDGEVIYVSDKFKTKASYFKSQFFTRDKKTHVYKLTDFAEKLILEDE